MEQQACYKFFIFYFLWILHGHQWFKMSPKGLSRITALLDRLVWVFCFGLVLICNSICTYFSYMELKHHHIPLMFRALLQKALSVILTVCRRVPRELRGESFFAVLCLSHYQVLILKLFYFTYWLCGKYWTEPIANAVSIVQTAWIPDHLLSQGLGQVQAINTVEQSVAGDSFKKELFWELLGRREQQKHCWGLENTIPPSLPSSPSIFKGSLHLPDT